MIEIQVVPEGPKALEVEAEGWWNDDHDVYTWPVRVGKWGAKIECHGSTPMEAQALALHVVTAIGALAQPSPKPKPRLVECDACPTSGGCVEVCMKAPVQPSPAPELEQPEVIGNLYLGGWADQDELEDNDIELDMKVVERLQAELASKGDGVNMPLMTVAQHDRIAGAHVGAIRLLADSVGRLRAECDAAQARVAELERVLAPFAEVADAYDPAEDDSVQPWKDAPAIDFLRLTLGQHRAAKVALGATDQVAQAGQVPEGWQLVPIDPTSQMTFVGQSLRYDAVNSIGEIYRQMIAAAPAQGGG